MIQTILGFLSPIIVYLFDQWIKTLNLSEKQIKNYYNFLEDVDHQTKTDVAQYIAAGDARKATIDRIKNRKNN